MACRKFFFCHRIRNSTVLRNNWYSSPLMSIIHYFLRYWCVQTGIFMELWFFNEFGQAQSQALFPPPGPRAICCRPPQECRWCDVTVAALAATTSWRAGGGGLPYRVVQGLESALAPIMATNDLEHPLCGNLGEGVLLRPDPKPFG